MGIPIDKTKYPNVFSGYNYAKQVVSGDIEVCKYVKGACRRFFKDIDKGSFVFDIDKAERYLRITQLFNHVKGKGWRRQRI